MTSRSSSAHAFRSRPLRLAMASLAPLVLAFLAPVGTAAADDGRFPDLGDCQQLRVDDGNTVSAYLFAVGMQNYRWNGARWVFVAPEAMLFADAGYHGLVVHPLRRSHLGEHQRQPGGRRGDRLLHPGPRRHPLAAARGGAEFTHGPRHLRRDDLHPAAEHRGRQGPFRPGRLRGRDREGALHRRLRLLPQERLTLAAIRGRRPPRPGRGRPRGSDHGAHRRGGGERP